MREEAVGELLAKTGSAWDIVRGLVDAGKLRESEYEGRKFYVRCFHRSSAPRD